jgi:hypothetical protein
MPALMFKYPRLLKFIMTVMLTAILSITTPGLLYQLSPVVASTTNLTQQASDQYRDRRFAEAAALFRQAAQTQTDPIQKALSLHRQPRPAAKRQSPDRAGPSPRHSR